MAEVYLQAESTEAIPTPGNILDLRMNGTLPFLAHGDGIDDRLREARGMLLVLESAYRTAHDARHDGQIDTITSLNPTIIADAIEGIATLLALGQYHHDEQGA